MSNSSSRRSWFYTPRPPIFALVTQCLCLQGVREGNSWERVSPGDRTLELFLLLDPRTYEELLGRAEETPNWPGHFRLSFYLEEVFSGFDEIRELGVPPLYTTKAYDMEIPRFVAPEEREWVAQLIGEPRQVTFYVADYLGESRLVEMIQDDLPPGNEPFSLRFSYDQG